MVNTGKPSTACLTCRRRKVKCDGAIPRCQRCARINRPCLGYRDQFDLIFKNTYASIDAHLHDKLYGLPTAGPQPYATISYATLNEPQNWHSQCYDPWESRKAEYWASAPTNDRHQVPERALLQRTWSSTDSQSGSTDSRDESPDPSPSLSVDVPEHALCYSLVQFDTNARVQYKIETFAFLPELIGRAGSKSAVHQAMRACGTINFANRAGPVDLHHETASEYARAIVSVNAALQDPDERCRDETLIAVWLLGMRELLLEVAGRSTTSSPDLAAMHRRQVHTDGTISLLGIRGEAQFERPLGRHISVTILSAMHWRPLFMSEEPSKEYLILESRMEKASPVTFEPARKLRAFFHGVTKLRARIKNFIFIHTKRTNSERYEVINSYLKAAERLERKMQDWCKGSEWQPQKVTPGAETSVIDSAYSSSTLYEYNALLLWNRYLVAKVALHAGLLDALQLLPEQDTSRNAGNTVDPEFADVRKHHKGALQDTADRFIGIIAYAFGDIDFADSPASPSSSRKAREININGALQLFQPLLFTSHLRYITNLQRNAIMEALHRITVAFRTR